MIQLILAQGLVHPVQIVPYLICMSTDLEQRVSHTADKELQDIEKKYPGFIHMKLMKGIRLSFQLQEVLLVEAKKTEVFYDALFRCCRNHLVALLEDTGPRRENFLQP